MAMTFKRALLPGVCAAAMLVVATAAPAAAETFSNTTAIRLSLPQPPPGCPTPTGCPSDKADPYPANIIVSGLSGTVTDVDVVLRDLTYTKDSPADIDMLLVGPGGRSIMVMSDACGDNSDAGAYPITTGITLTFDDSAGSLLPADAPCATGTFRPIDDDDDGAEIPLSIRPEDNIPDASPPAGTQPLSTFNGIDGNGTWSLHVVDDAPTDPDPSGRAGQIGGGWSLLITTSGGGTSGLSSVTSPGAQPQVTTTTTRAGATTTTVRSATTTTVARSSAAQTTTTARPLATSGKNTDVLSVAGGLLLATGVAMVAVAGPVNRRRKQAQLYVVSWR